MGSRALVLVLLTACGRFAFDPLEGDDNAPPDTTTASLVARWTFEGGSYADTASGAFPAMGPAATTIAGVDGDAVQLDGSQCLEVPGLESWNPSELTITAWVRDPASTGAVVTHEFSDGCPSHALEISNDAVGLVQLNETDAHNEAWMAMGAAMTDWHQLAVKWDGVAQEVYVDGVCVCMAVPTLRPVPAVTAPFELGCYPASGMPNFQGGLDDVRIFDRALDADELAGLYAVDGRVAPTPIDCAQACSALP